MNKKEVLEIRKQFTPDRCAITKICGCYVDHEKTKKTEFTKTFLSLPEDEAFKYYDIFRHTLSGTIGKNLLNMEFPLDAELNGGTQEFLLKLRDSKLEDEALVDEFYDKVIDNYMYAENYYITLIHASYDVPGRSMDGEDMFDASDVVYEHILCSICPVNLTKAGLSYNALTNSIEDRIRDWLVEAPLNGFLFPAFNDRGSDIHQVLFYSKKPEEIQPDFITNVLGSQIPLTAGDEKLSFQTIVSETLGQECDFETVKTIHENLQELIDEAKDSPDPVTFSKPDLKHLLERSGAKEEQMENFDDQFETQMGEQKTLQASNISAGRSFQMNTPDVVIKVNPARTDLLRTEVIEGKKCLVIEINDGLEVNGIEISKF